MQWVVHKCLIGSINLKREEPSFESNPCSGHPYFDSEGIVYHKYAPNGQTINKEFYVEVLRHLCKSVHRKQLDKWRDGDWILHHDNAPTHTSHLVQQFLAKHGTAQLQQPPYSPDLALCDFFLFPRLKKVLKGHRLEATEDIKQNLTKTLLDISERGVHKMFPTVAETLSQVCSCRRELCWRQLGLKPRKPYQLHVLWSVWILFEQTSYFQVINMGHISSYYFNKDIYVTL